MSRALVLVAGLYVFLSPIVINKRGNKNERKQVLKVATDMNKAKGTTNNRAIECSLCAPFQQGAHKNKPQKNLSSIE
jgi:PDZ domain-containing secreted protein